VAEVRAVGQPPGLLARSSAEHWAGRLYMRRLSPHVTRALLRTPATPNGVTWAMTACGLLAALVLTLPGLAAALGAAALIQLQLLLDCVDGELARWQDKRSPAGVYLDQVAHTLTEAALPIALGVRADGGWDSLGGWTTLGLVVSVLVLVLKAETALVVVARAESGRPPARDDAVVAAPRASGLRRLRRALRFAPFYKAFVAVEASLLAVAAAIWDAAAGDLSGTRFLLAALVPIAAVTAAGHLAAILASGRLR
jgi:phosphatidylglycerophosphate synthase